MKRFAAILLASSLGFAACAHDAAATLLAGEQREPPDDGDQRPGPRRRPGPDRRLYRSRMEAVHRDASAGELLREKARVEDVPQLGAPVRFHDGIATLE